MPKSGKIFTRQMREMSLNISKMKQGSRGATAQVIVAFAVRIEKCVTNAEQKHREVTLAVVPRTFIRKIDGSGEGLFAAQDIKLGQYIGQYTGEIFTLAESNDRVTAGITSKFYEMTLSNATPELVVDAERRGNSVRKINHSCNPNSEFYTRFVNGEPRVATFAIKTIKANKQITVSYGPSYAAFNMKCNCGEPNCVEIIGN